MKKILPALIFLAIIALVFYAFPQAEQPEQPKPLLVQVVHLKRTFRTASSEDIAAARSRDLASRDIAK